MEELSKYFTQIQDKLNIFVNDLQRMSYNLEAPEDKKKDMKSLQRVTNLRETKKEAQDAKDNPQAAFITDTLNNIFEG